MRVLRLSAMLFAFGMAASAQVDLQEALKRLDQLEEQNRQLMSEIQVLRKQLTAAATTAITPPQPVEEKLAVQDTRLADLDQTKVGTDHRLPLTLTGTVLFNAYLNGRGSGGAFYPVRASATRLASGGATMRQTILGLKFHGPQLPFGGKMTGFVYMDFFGGDDALQQNYRLRIANLSAEWKNTTLSFAFDKPLIAPRDPDSLAQVGVSPLTAAGNLWLWRPQVRLEQRFALGDQVGIRAQAALYQTNEAGTGLSDEYSSTLAASRPGYQGRLEFWAEHNGKRMEIAPGFHISSTRVVGISVPSRIFSIDWLIRPAARLDLTGTFFNGENVPVLGSTRQGVNLNYNGNAVAVGATGGWAQLKYRLTSRLTLNGFSGIQDDENRLLERNVNNVLRNTVFGANLFYRLGSNVITGIEASQVRTMYQLSGLRINQHYDLAIAYLF